MWKQSERSKLPRSQGRKSGSLPSGAKTFDAETGQVYTESQVRVGSKHYTDWLRELKTPSLIKPISLSAEGTRTLLDTAKICVIKQVRSLNQEHFSMVPWSIAQCIWEEIVAR